MGLNIVVGIVAIVSGTLMSVKTYLEIKEFLKRNEKDNNNKDNK